MLLLFLKSLFSSSRILLFGTLNAAIRRDVVKFLIASWSLVFLISGDDEMARLWRFGFFQRLEYITQHSSAQSLQSAIVS